MNPPNTVKASVALYLLSAIISVCLALLGVKLGITPKGEAVTSIVLAGILCFIPYKIYNGSKGIVIFYTVMCVMAVLIVGLLPPMANIDKLDIGQAIVLNCMACFLLYTPSAKGWFR